MWTGGGGERAHGGRRQTILLDSLLAPHDLTLTQELCLWAVMQYSPRTAFKTLSFCRRGV